MAGLRFSPLFIARSSVGSHRPIIVLLFGCWLLGQVSGRAAFITSGDLEFAVVFASWLFTDRAQLAVQSDGPARRVRGLTWELGCTINFKEA